MSTTVHIPPPSGQNLTHTPTAEYQSVEKGRLQRQPSEFDPFNPEKFEKERFPDALAAITDDQPVYTAPIAKVQQSMANINPVPAIQQTTHDITQSMANMNPVPAIQQTTHDINQSFEADSHDLAHSSAVNGALQDGNGPVRGEVRDIGWHRPNLEIPDPLIGGITNGHLFAMIRRFNKDVFAVQAVPPHVARGLDLNEAWSDEYTNDKLPLHLQRLYLSIVLNMASFGKQVSRLRSWKETRRTSAFCTVYFLAWVLDLLIPLTLATLMLIISSPSARDTLFPPAPRALVNMNTGGLQNPASRQLGTLDSLTGAPEKQEGEAIEEEAANFVSNVRHMVQRAVGMHEKEEGHGDPLEGKVPKPIRKGVKAIKAAGTDDGHATGEVDHTQKPMEEVLWNKVNPEIVAKVMKKVPHVVGEIVDNWERFANAISSIPPFSNLTFARIDAVILPLFLGSFFITSYMVYKGAGFAVGLGIFGDPVLTPALEWLNQNYPNYLEMLEPKNNILRGVPTNSQLTLTLLRIGEVHNTPIPPVPTSNPKDADQHQAVNLNDLPVGESPAAKLSAIQETPALHTDTEPLQKEEPKHKHLSKITRIFKGNTKGAVETKLAVDHVRAKAGSEKAKGHLGVLPKRENLVYAGPSHFKGRLDGKQGWLCIVQSQTQRPTLLYTTKDPRSMAERNGDSRNEKLDPQIGREELAPVVGIDIEGIQKLKRATAFVSKAIETAVNWSEEKDLLASLEVEDADGKMWRFTALPERDELFNRLVAVGGQRWVNL
ncbi:uncharacterized protein RAG0_00177 [Rhynchosporium agropyri]|uniref:Uncharacterized protein n=1 Tax=Rhynchosporium agropyri TaxID=914238 RepID=A0A1E1JRY7_9HELO|nr:uncharacterized protein RAG0_00177 [Rhynchosporium agropyri]